MKKVTPIFLAAILVSLVSLTVGCGPKPVSPYGGSSTMPGGQNGGDGSGQGMISEEIGPSEDSLDSTGGGRAGNAENFSDQNSDEYKGLHGRSSPEMQPIYFDFDQAAIRSDQTSRLEQNGAYLKNNGSARVVVEGNCDERGTNEYNLALGERRALNAKKYLMELGIEDFRIRTVSYGEERPLFQGSDEDSMSQNRRDDFILE
jgi:peptidoglycan-associated lipoprotein